ncbi:MAG: MlaD family protein [Planctomycetota bacterium]
MTDEPASDFEVPDAIVDRRPRRRFLGGGVWLVPLLALVAAVGVSWSALSGRGPTIVIHANDGHGIRPGDPVRYLGIDVGSVRDVALGGGREGADVRLDVQMRKDAADLARAGTRFWIVRPQLSVDSVEGLETLIGARYVALVPGPPDAERRSQFNALEEPPLDAELAADRGLEIVLEAPARFGLQPGARLAYRGVNIGTVIAVGLASDATSVEVRVLVRPAYSQLVRERSVFWETGGFELGLSITGGLEIDLDSFKSALVGGVALATPVDAGPAVSTGSRFPLYADPEDAWLDWQPALPLGNDLLPPGASLPKLLRGSLVWERGRILRSTDARTAWMLPTPRGLLGPRDLLAVPSDAREGRAVLQVAGKDVQLSELQAQGHLEDRGEHLRVVKPEAFGAAWDGLLEPNEPVTTRTHRALASPEDLLVVRESGRDPLGIDASRLRLEGDRALIDDRIPVAKGWHGALAMARRDGAVVGMLIVEPRAAYVVPIP